MTRREWITLLPAAVLARHGDTPLLRAMQEVMGPLPEAPRGKPLFRVLEEREGDSYLRRKIAYVPEPGDEVPAWLLIPRRLRGKAPAMLCLHQTTKIGKDEPAGLGGKSNLHYARELAERGFVTLSPDYPTFGDYHIDVYARGYASATMKGIWNHFRAIDLIQTLPEVKTKRIGVIGHSLGGHNALFLAAFDTRLGAVVTSCGFTSFHRYYNGDLTGWSHKGYMPRIAERFGNSPDRMPFDFPGILASLAPRRVFINAPLHDANFDVTGVRECVDKAKPAWRHKSERLVATYPDCEHDFPPEIRRRAYEFLASWAR